MNETVDPRLARQLGLELSRAALAYATATAMDLSDELRVAIISKNAKSREQYEVQWFVMTDGKILDR